MHTSHTGRVAMEVSERPTLEGRIGAASRHVKIYFSSQQPGPEMNRGETENKRKEINNTRKKDIRLRENVSLASVTGSDLKLHGYFTLPE